MTIRAVAVVPAFNEARSIGAVVAGVLPFAREVIVVFAGRGFGIRAPCLPSRFEQRQLLFRQLLTFAVALRLQQFSQQTLILVLLGQGTVELFGQIHDDLPQRLCIPRQAVRIDGHRAYRLRGNGSISKSKQQ